MTGRRRTIPRRGLTGGALGLLVVGTFAVLIAGSGGGAPPLGYLTGMLGQYLNGSLPRTRHIPPGWTSWDVAGNGYPEFNYNLNEDGRLVHYASAPSDYLTDVLARKGAAFVDQAANAGRP